MSRPVAFDLFCGRGGWTKGCLAEGYSVVGFDIEYQPSYPGEFVLKSVLEINGADLADAALILGSSPCQEFSYRAMPWKRAKALPPPYGGITLFNAQFRIQQEASKVAGRHIPMVIENVKGAQPWVGSAKAHYGSYFLWGDVNSIGGRIVIHPQFGTTLYGHHRHGMALKHPDQCSPRNWSDRDAIQGGDWWSGTKNNGGSWFAVANNTTSGHSQNPVIALEKQKRATEAVKNGLKGSGGGWFHENKESPGRKFNSRSSARKAASAAIAEIPYELASWVARCYKP